MRIRSLVLGFAAVVASAMPSFAADIVEEAAVEARWTGFYAGVLGGYFASTLGQSGCVGFCPVTPRYDSWGLGIQAGYDHQFSNDVVLGGYARVMLAAHRIRQWRMPRRARPLRPRPARGPR